MTRFAEYDQFDATGLAQLVRNGEVTAGELLEEAITRTEEINPRINAVIGRMFDQARKSVRQDIAEGPFSGVPFLIKDLIQSYAGVPLTCGSAALAEYIPDRDSEVIARFKRAGLITFGKTNVPELGLVATTEPRAFGPTRNRAYAQPVGARLFGGGLERWIRCGSRGWPGADGLGE
jgi:amidase